MNLFNTVLQGHLIVELNRNAGLQAMRDSLQDAVAEVLALESVRTLVIQAEAFNPARDLVVDDRSIIVRLPAAIYLYGFSAEAPENFQAVKRQVWIELLYDLAQAIWLQVAGQESGQLLDNWRREGEALEERNAEQTQENQANPWWKFWTSN